MRHRIFLYLLAIPLLFGLATGCGQAKKKEAQKQTKLQQQSLDLAKAYEGLQGLRAKVAEEQASLEELKKVPKRKLSDEQKQQIAQLPDQIKADSEAVATAYDTVQDKLSNFLNFALNEAPKAPETAGALEIYSKEAMVNAEDAVQKVGDYKKAIEILQTAESYYESAGLTPYPPLKDRMQKYDELRFITKDRFEAAKKGMNESEVAAITGVPYYMNKKHEHGVDFWLFPRRDGGAAAFYFNKHGKLYSKRWDAVKPKVHKD